LRRLSAAANTAKEVLERFTARARAAWPVVAMDRCPKLDRPRLVPD